MKLKILFALIGILLMFSCKNLYRNLFMKSYNTEANIEIHLESIDVEYINRIITILNYRFGHFLIDYNYKMSEIPEGKLEIQVKNYKSIEELKSLLVNQGQFVIKVFNDDGKIADSFVLNDDETTLKKVSVNRNYNKRLCLDLELKNNYIHAFETFTEKYIGRQTSFELDGQILFKPVITDKIPGGNIQLSMADDISVDQLQVYRVLLSRIKLPIKLNEKNCIIIEKPVQTSRSE